MNRLLPVRTDTVRRQQLLTDVIQSALSLTRQSPPIESGQALTDKVYGHLQPLRALFSDEGRADSALKLISTMISTHLEPHLTTARRIYIQWETVQTQLTALTVHCRELVDLKRKRDELRAKAIPAVQAVRAAYLRLAMLVLVMLLTLGGEAGLVFVVSMDMVGEESLFASLSAAGIALAFVLFNEALVCVGLAPLYAKLYAALFPSSSIAIALRNQTQSPAGSVPPSVLFGKRLISHKPLTLSLMVAMTVVQILFIVSVTLLRKEYVSENTEGVFLFNSTCSILLLSFFSHKLLEVVIVRYPAARDLRAQLPYRDELAQVKVAFKDTNNRMRITKPLKRQAVRLERRFQKATNIAYRLACRDPKIAQTVKVINLQLADTQSTPNPAANSPVPQPAGINTTGTPTTTAPPAAVVSPPQQGKSPFATGVSIGTSPSTFRSQPPRTPPSAASPNSAAGVSSVTPVAQGVQPGTPPTSPPPQGNQPMSPSSPSVLKQGTSIILLMLCASTLLFSSYGCRRASAPLSLEHSIYRDKTNNEQHSSLIASADKEATNMVIDQLTNAAKSYQEVRVDLYTTPPAGNTVGESRHHIEFATHAKRLTPREQKRQLEEHKAQLASLFAIIEKEPPVQGESAILAPVAALIRRMSEKHTVPNAYRQLTVISNLEEYSPKGLTASQIAEAPEKKFQQLLETVKRKYPAVAHPPQKLVFLVVDNDVRRTEAYQNRLREFWRNVGKHWGITEVEFVSPQSHTVHGGRRLTTPAEENSSPGLQEQTQARREPSLTLKNQTEGDIVLKATDTRSQARYQFTFPAKTEQTQTLPIGKFAWTLTYEQAGSSDKGRCAFKPYRNYFASIRIGKGNSDLTPITIGDPE